MKSILSIIGSIAPVHRAVDSNLLFDRPFRKRVSSASKLRYRGLTWLALL